MHYIEVQNFFNGVLNILNPWVAKFNNLMAVGTDKMVVLFIPVLFFVLSQILPELVFAYQVTLHQ